MWIEKRKDKNGKISYKYNERYIDPKTNKRKKVSVTYKNKSRDTQKEALNVLNAMIAEKLQTKQIRKPEMTFHKLIDEEWLPVYINQVRESTYLPTKNLLKTVKKEIPADQIISQISTTDLNDLFEKLLYEKKLSNKYVSVIKSKINLIFNYALKKQYILENPMRDVSIDYKREEISRKIKDKFLEDDEYKRLIDYSMKRNKRYGLLFQWMYLTGMRAGEATALQKDDIIITDTEAYAIVNGTLQYRERKITDMKKSNQTKTSAGMRNVDLSKKAVGIAKEFQRMNADLNTDFLFTTSNGTPILITALNTYMRRHKEKFGVDKPLSTHIFRHTHISKLAELGTPLYAIQERVGHENSDITEKIYLHVTKNVKDKVKNDIEKL